MNAELIIIGNELLNGKISDKNTKEFATFCRDQGIDLQRVTIIQDNEESFNSIMSQAIKRSDIIVTSGGLGPTKDDLTKKMLASFFNKKIQFSNEALKIVDLQYSSKDRIFDKETSDYQNIPTDFEALLNPTGYAPALFYSFDKNKLILATPGVPSEFKSIINISLKAKLPVLNSKNNQVIVKTRFIPEAKIFNDLCPGLWEKLEKYGQVSSLPNPLGVDIGVILNDSTNRKIVTDIICESSIKENIWHVGSESLEELVVKEAKGKKVTFGFAESCTGGLCASRITDISGCSEVFWGSVVSYANEVKERIIDVNAHTLKEHGAVSLETAKEMAIGAKASMNCDVIVSTTGIAGPGGGSTDKPVGTVAIGFTSKEETGSKIFNFNGNREDLKFRFSQAALFKLLDLIRAY
jgi:nicotinamide-nucleotide amidase